MTPSKYEFRVVSTGSIDDNLSADLTQLGTEGWDVAQIIPLAWKTYPNNRDGTTVTEIERSIALMRKPLS